MLDYISELDASKAKDARIKRNQIDLHLETLSKKGTAAGMPYLRHLDGEIWELRPTRDRILFAGVLGGAFVLLHHFMKKTQKTPRQEIERAKRELQDFIDRGGAIMNGTDVKEDAACSSWIEWTPELRAKFFSPDEILNNTLMARVMCALIDARREKHIGRQELAAMSGVNRSTISKIAMGAANPSVWTLIRMLRPLGLTLDVVPIEEVLKEEDQFREQGEEQVESISDSVTQLPN